MLYHIHPPNFFSDHLMPLNQIKNLKPELYTRLAKKYVGQEALMERNIPVLNCKWNDVLFFSAVHPERIKNQFQQLGLNWGKNLQHWLALDPEKIPDFNANTVIYHPIAPLPKGDLTISPRDIYPFHVKQLPAPQQLSVETMLHYKSSLTNKHPLFVFHRIPRILHHGKIAKTQFTTLTIGA